VLSRAFVTPTVTGVSDEPARVQGRTGKLLAFKRAPSVELRLDRLSIEVKKERVFVSISGADDVWLSWDEWRDLAQRVEHSMQWIAANTPGDVTGRSFTDGA